jgi:hypothetical protein
MYRTPRIRSNIQSPPDRHDNDRAEVITTQEIDKGQAKYMAKSLLIVLGLATAGSIIDGGGRKSIEQSQDPIHSTGHDAVRMQIDHPSVGKLTGRQLRPFITKS